MPDSALSIDSGSLPLVDRSSFLARTLFLDTDKGFVPVGILASPGPIHPMALAVVENTDALGLPKTGVPGIRILEELARTGNIAELSIPAELFEEFELSDLSEVACTGAPEKAAALMATSAFNELVLGHPFYADKDAISYIFKLSPGKDAAQSAGD